MLFDYIYFVFWRFMLCILVVFWSKLIEDDLIGINDIKEK